LAQAGQWLARKFVWICKFCARPNGSEAPPAPSRRDVICKRATAQWTADSNSLKQEKKVKQAEDFENE
jgi:hypothetical protein